MSGVYIAKLMRTDTGGASHITFIVRDDNGELGCAVPDVRRDVARLQQLRRKQPLLTSARPAGRAYKVSYNRPFNHPSTVDGVRAGACLFNAEYPMMRWLEANGYDVGYTTRRRHAPEAASC